MGTQVQYPGEAKIFFNENLFQKNAFYDHFLELVKNSIQHVYTSSFSTLTSDEWMQNVGTEKMETSEMKKIDLHVSKSERSSCQLYLKDMWMVLDGQKEMVHYGLST